MNVSCQNINLDDNFNEFYSKGGCFRTKNVLFRELINMSIINVTSKNTSAGFKAIDDENELASLKNEFIFLGRSQVFYFINDIKILFHF